MLIHDSVTARQVWRLRTRFFDLPMRSVDRDDACNDCRQYASLRARQAGVIGRLGGFRKMSGTNTPALDRARLHGIRPMVLA
jgi:hypothetical protein